MSHYRAGADFEREVRSELHDNGYWVIRAAGSKTKADLIAVKPGEVLFIQCKRDGKLPPSERIEVRRLAAMLPGTATPVLAARLTKPARIGYWQLTGNGPRDRQEWTPDQVGGKPA